MKRKVFLSVLVLVTMLLAACASPTPVVVKEEVIVEKEIPVTVEVEKEVLVEKEVIRTVEVEKEVVVETEFPTGRFVHENPNVWAFEFDEDGTWRGYMGDVDKPIISGKYATNGNLYTEMTHDYPTSPKIPATYMWTYDGQKLTFHLWGEDVNAHRKSVYDGQTYIKVE